MHATRENDQIILSFRSPENRLMNRVLKAIIRNYQIRPEELSSPGADVWYSTRGCQTARMSADETKEWLENLFQYKSANVRLIEQWLKSVSGRKATQYHVQLTLAEAPVLMTALNDHRLLLAARYRIGQGEMDLRSLSALHQLRPVRQA